MQTKAKGIICLPMLFLAVIISIMIASSYTSNACTTYYYQDCGYHSYGYDYYYGCYDPYYYRCGYDVPYYDKCSQTAGSLVISGEKLWDDEYGKQYRPSSIVVGLYKYSGTFNSRTATLIQTKTVTARDNWKYSFDITNESLTDAYGNQYKFKVVEGSINNYKEDASLHKDPNVYFLTPSDNPNGRWVRYEPCNRLAITSRGNDKSVVVSKKGKDYVVWTPEPLTASEKTRIYNSYSAYVNGYQGSKISNVVFISGIGASYDGFTVYQNYICYDAHCKWSLVAKGLYRKSTAEENSARLVNKLTITDYSVRYLDKDTNQPVAPEKKVTGKSIGMNVSENAVSVENYDVYGNAQKSINLVADPSKNIITFYYVHQMTDYTVKYVEKGTTKEIAPSKLVSKQKVGITVTETAESSIGDYDLADASQKSLKLVKDAGRNIIIFEYVPAVTDYTVKYVEKGTANEIAPAKHVDKQKVGSDVKETAEAAIGNYDLADDAQKSIRLVRDGSQNIIIFEYVRAMTDYNVKYLEEGTQKALKPEKIKKDCKVGVTVIEIAPATIDYYELIGKTSQAKTLVRDASQNEIIFWYKQALSDYTVQYIDRTTGQQIHAEKVVEGIRVGSVPTENAIDIENYDLDDEATKSIEIQKDASQNVLKFYYKPAMTDYVVKYMEKGTTKEIADAKLVPNQKVGSQPEENAIDVENYELSDQAKKSIKLVRDKSQNVIIFEYVPILTDYTVKYVEKGTTNEIASPKHVTDQRVGSTPEETAASTIGNYDLADQATKSIRLVKDGTKNVIIFEYVPAVSDYNVKYLEEGTKNPVKTEKIVKNQKVGSEVTETTEQTIGYYELIGEPVQKKTIARDASQNEMIFWYKQALTDYTVQYIDRSTDKQICDPKSVKAQRVGSIAEERAKSFDDYTLYGDEVQTKELQKEASSNVITFYYDPIPTGYTVKYVIKGTDTEIADRKVMNDLRIGSSVTEHAKTDIENYEVYGETTKSAVLKKGAENNVIIFEYTPLLTEYTVRYLVRGTDEVLGSSSYKDCKVGSEQYATAPAAIDKYDLDDQPQKSITLVRNGAENVITFYYDVALTGYTVRCIDEETGKNIIPDKIYHGEKVDTNKIVTAPDLNELLYSPVAPTSIRKKLVRDENENIYIFKYHFNG